MGNNAKKLVTLIELVHKTMKEADYEPVQEHFEIGDIIHLPAMQPDTNPPLILSWTGPCVHHHTLAVHTHYDSKPPVLSGDQQVILWYCSDMLLKSVHSPSHIMLRDAHHYDMIQTVNKHANEEDQTRRMLRRKLSS